MSSNKLLQQRSAHGEFTIEDPDDADFETGYRSPPRPATLLDRSAAQRAHVRCRVGCVRTRTPGAERT